MSKSVEVNYVGIPHYYASCHECDWTYEDYRDRRRGQSEIRKHVKDTGHTVALEKTHVVHYAPSEGKVTNDIADHPHQRL